MNQQMTKIPGKFFPHAISNPDTRLTIARRAQAGETLTALAAEYGVSTRTVQRYRDALGGE